MVAEVARTGRTNRAVLDDAVDKMVLGRNEVMRHRRQWKSEWGDKPETIGELLDMAEAAASGLPGATEANIWALNQIRSVGKLEDLARTVDTEIDKVARVPNVPSNAQRRQAPGANTDGPMAIKLSGTDEFVPINDYLKRRLLADPLNDPSYFPKGSSGALDTGLKGVERGPKVQYMDQPVGAPGAQRINWDRPYFEFRFGPGGLGNRRRDYNVNNSPRFTTAGSPGISPGVWGVKGRTPAEREAALKSSKVYGFEADIRIRLSKITQTDTRATAGTMAKPTGTRPDNWGYMTSRAQVRNRVGYGTGRGADARGSVSPGARSKADSGRPDFYLPRPKKNKSDPTTTRVDESKANNIKILLPRRRVLT